MTIFSVGRPCDVDEATVQHKLQTTQKAVIWVWNGETYQPPQPVQAKEPRELLQNWPDLDKAFTDSEHIPMSADTGLFMNCDFILTTDTVIMGASNSGKTRLLRAMHQLRRWFDKEVILVPAPSSTSWPTEVGTVIRL